MKLLGFMKNGKGTVHETGELSAASGSIDIIKKLDNGVTVVEIRLGSPKMEASQLRGNLKNRPAG